MATSVIAPPPIETDREFFSTGGAPSALITTPVQPPRSGFNSPLRQIIADAFKLGQVTGTRLDEIAPQDLALAETDATADAMEFAEIALADAGIGIDRASQRAAWTITTKRAVEAWLAGMGDGGAAERAEMRADSRARNWG